VADKKTKASTPYGRNSQANQASTSKTLGSTSAKQASTSKSQGSSSAKKASTSKTKGRAVPIEQASPSETGVPLPFMLELRCIVENGITSFKVPILSNKDVGDLKDAIKAKKPDTLPMEADKLILKLTLDGGVTKKELDKLTESSLEVLDDEREKLSTYFPEKPAEELIHIVVKLPEQ
ncbi:hypothetical protein BGX27_005898, partial [Mortierella sp. AM989]